VLSGDLSFVGGGTIITIAGGGGSVLGNCELGLSGDGGVVFGCVLLVGRLCLFVVVYSGYCGWLRFSEDSGS
jgi:hypothetical protein